ncbi:MAG: hypothetical protein LBP59_10865 [Planctomycetaceae bacterium]|nr:hypothetical protein [Planctomycetaceae bacterium]
MKMNLIEFCKRYVSNYENRLNRAVKDVCNQLGLIDELIDNCIVNETDRLFLKSVINDSLEMRFCNNVFEECLTAASTVTYRIEIIDVRPHPDYDWRVELNGHFIGVINYSAGICKYEFNGGLFQNNYFNFYVIRENVNDLIDQLQSKITESIQDYLMLPYIRIEYRVRFIESGQIVDDFGDRKRFTNPQHNCKKIDVDNWMVR